MPYKPGDLTDNTRRGRALYAASRGDATAQAALREYGDAMRALGRATFGDDTSDSSSSDHDADSVRDISAGRATYRQRHARPATTGDDAA